MIQINLLPWRERAREIKKKDFFVAVGISSGVALFLIFLFHLYYDDLIAFQDQRNTFLQMQISQKQAAIDTLRKDKKQQQLIEVKLQFLFGLRERSYRAVRLLSEILKIVPNTITLLKLQRKGNTIIIEGNAQSALAITAFLKSLSQDPVFNQPVLTEIQTNSSKGGISERYFQVTVEQKDAHGLQH